MARVAPEDTAFSQRDAEGLVAAMALFEIDGDPGPSDGWTTAFFATFVDSMTGVYANFLGAEGEDRIRAAYPHGAYEWRCQRAAGRRTAPRPAARPPAPPSTAAGCRSCRRGSGRTGTRAG